MNKVQICPCYTLTAPIKREEVLTKLRETPGDQASELSLDIEEKNEGTERRCTLGPRSALWTMFAAFYGFAVLLGIGGLILGLCQLWLGLYAYDLWLVRSLQFF